MNSNSFLLGLICLIVAIASVNAACQCSSSNRRVGICKEVPSDGNYYLTSFCDKETACGVTCGNCSWPYATSAGRFGCNARLNCCQGSKCIVLRVIDSGPACWVEDKAGRAIIDASYTTCRYFTGSNSCGWSDRVSINCRRTLLTQSEDSYLGPCTTDLTAVTKDLPLCPITIDE